MKEIFSFTGASASGVEDYSSGYMPERRPLLGAKSGRKAMKQKLQSI